MEMQTLFYRLYSKHTQLFRLKFHSLEKETFPCQYSALFIQINKQKQTGLKA